MDLKEIMARNLRRARHDKQLTQEELADRAGLSMRYVGAIERGDVSASVTVLGQIADALEIEPGDLLKKTTDSMDIVAQKVGFTTTSTFNRNFKKFLNTSPYQWKINPENYETKLLNYNISARKGW